MSDTGGAIRSAEMMLAQMERDVARANLIGTHGLPQHVMPFAQQGNIIRGAEVAKLWRRVGRQSLAIHPGLVDEVRMASSAAFPMELLRALPYLNPMVIYSDPPELTSWRASDGPARFTPYVEATMRLIGFFISGSRHFGERTNHIGFDSNADAIEWVKDDVCETHDPTAEALGIVAMFDILNDSGRSIDYEVASLSIGMAGEATLEEIVQMQVERFEFISENTMTTDRETWIREVYQILLGTVLYLCSTTLDVEKVPASATKHLVGTAARKHLNLYRVGWKIGQALSRYRRESSDAEGTGRGGQQRPCHRKCHFRMQWYGPVGAPKCSKMRGTCQCKGRHREWIFIAPYWTHRELLGESGDNMVRRVV
jgi:hypothetical protein